MIVIATYLRLCVIQIGDADDGSYDLSIPNQSVHLVLQSISGYGEPDASRRPGWRVNRLSKQFINIGT